MCELLYGIYVGTTYSICELLEDRILLCSTPLKKEDMTNDLFFYMSLCSVFTYHCADLAENLVAKTGLISRSQNSKFTSPTFRRFISNLKTHRSQRLPHMSICHTKHQQITATFVSEKPSTVKLAKQPLLFPAGKERSLLYRLLRPYNITKNQNTHHFPFFCSSPFAASL